MATDLCFVNMSCCGIRDITHLLSGSRASGGGLWISRTGGSGQTVTLSHKSSDSESEMRRRGMSDPGESQKYWGEDQGKEEEDEKDEDKTFCWN